MNLITAEQSRAARRELSLSQANVSEATGLNRQYISEFESGHSTRLTNAQTRKLRSFYETKIEEARANGDEIELTFGDAEPETLAIRVETVSTQQCTFPVGKEVSEEVIAATLATIGDIDKRLVGLLTTVAKREQSLFGQGDFNTETLAAFRESFSLCACAYLLIRSIGGWPEIGLSAANMNISGDSVLSEVINNVSDYFRQAGLIGESDLTTPKKADKPEEVEV